MEAANYNDDAVLYSSYNLTLQDGILYQPLFHEKFHPAKCESRKVPILVSARSKKSQSKTPKEISRNFYGFIWYSKLHNFRKSTNHSVSRKQG